jgi:hypothetical protein
MICIPLRFQLGGRNWKVEVVSLVLGETDVLGATDSDEAIIYLREGMTPEMLNHTFYHELEHAFRATLGIPDDDEGQVDARGGMLLQYLSSKRGRV